MVRPIRGQLSHSPARLPQLWDGSTGTWERLDLCQRDELLAAGVITNVVGDDSGSEVYMRIGGTSGTRCLRS